VPPSRSSFGSSRRSLSGQLGRFLIRLVLLFVAASVGWVLVYRFVPVPLTWPMGRDAINGRHLERDWEPLANMAPAMARSVIAAEDSRFCSHSGFDLEAMEAAVLRNAEGGRLRGGSTISQQTAKNAFLWPGRSYVRKVLEAWFTVLIELLWDKPRIMEVYLNIAEMGPGVYGAEAAARHYFNVSASKLSNSQAARIAAILPQPVKRKAAAPGPFVRRYARNIERRARIVRRDGLDACLQG